MKKLFSAFFAIVLLLGMVFSPASIFAKDTSTGEYLVQFDGKVEKGLLKAFGVKDEEILHTFDLLPVVTLKLSERQAKGLSNHPKIKFVEENAAAQALGQPIPWGVPKVQSTEVNDLGFTGKGMKVAILDTGIDRNHEDLSANVQGGFSVFTDSANSDPYYDGSGHGTHVAGTVAAVNNNLGVIGVAYHTDLYAVKVLNNSGSGSYEGIAKGIEWSIQNGMDIINMSLGGSSSSSILEQFCDLAYNEGVLLVAAAGNSGTRPGRGDNVGYPAKYDSVIAVAATDQNDNRGTFSSTGPAVEISAPGVSILSTTPNNNYASYNGTSMASPHVAAVAALVWEAKPNLTNVELRQLLNQTAKDLGTASQYGHGLVQAFAAIQY
ncbi:S8 family peptidase [Anaerobacillus isosaccharinicus]|uniref:Peptidase S8 n=1 Tax=Anaerobacillus isosaccharinicus TaxID=1532552 RepID=A0A1S2M888_9BACI|nr:S8 family peptidase [Anaerobacillus isosaccharinicus]MBA5586748.1 S8 family peptidase [Anaerobacillus isosaccharinicus]QOY35030.1 S8 family peptidase [Anaerobacillus isosaccharinicus]